MLRGCHPPLGELPQVCNDGLMQIRRGLVQALCRLCAASSRPIFVILPILCSMYGGRSEETTQPAFLCSLPAVSRWAESASLYGQEILGGRKKQDCSRMQGVSLGKARNGRSACGAHVFPGGEDASVEFFVQNGGHGVIILQERPTPQKISFACPGVVQIRSVSLIF
jgi:hypothetical protein